MNDIFKGVVVSNQKNEIDRKLAMGLMNKLQEYLSKHRSGSKADQLDKTRLSIESQANAGLRARLLAGREAIIDLTVIQMESHNKVSMDQYKSILNQINMSDKLNNYNKINQKTKTSSQRKKYYEEEDAAVDESYYLGNYDL